MIVTQTFYIPDCTYDKTAAKELGILEITNNHNCNVYKVTYIDLPFPNSQCVADDLEEFMNSRARHNAFFTLDPFKKMRMVKIANTICFFKEVDMQVVRARNNEYYVWFKYTLPNDEIIYDEGQIELL